MSSAPTFLRSLLLTSVYKKENYQRKKVLGLTWFVVTRILPVFFYFSVIDQYSRVPCWYMESIPLGRKTLDLSKLLHSLTTRTQSFSITSVWYYPVLLAEGGESSCPWYVCYIFYMQLKYNKQRAKMLF